MPNLTSGTTTEIKLLGVGTKIQLFFPSSDIHGWKGEVVSSFESGGEVFYEVKIDKDSIGDLDKYLELCKANNLTPFRIRARAKNIKALYIDKNKKDKPKKEHVPNITKNKDIDEEKGEILEQF